MTTTPDDKADEIKDYIDKEYPLDVKSSLVEGGLFAGGYIGGRVTALAHDGYYTGFVNELRESLADSFPDTYYTSSAIFLSLTALRILPKYVRKQRARKRVHHPRKVPRSKLFFGDWAREDKNG